ncbi:dienelactone hydrolase family protein [Salinimicrobium sp. MT39]|jgi:phospholipase/carboxylesterase|uniref:Dienelactone hydrolase family protein n=1 Tax=Salinimicrobium profundisediminis TaxID=2994553 RepID=A0A9X3CYW4_9FLAO|nr:dienelactone hydrolase family protein [Salinimicrobium profundisediminis]MCX2839506.1 dienelactone hydrolase family protein [Salinimicrobium profundisediminis]
MLHQKDFKYNGTPLKDAKKALIMVHGRGGFAEDILAVADHLKIEDFALVAPQAYNNSWYPLSFMAPVQQNQPWLDSAVEMLQLLEKELNDEGIASEDIYFFGFSQGACLTLEYVTRNAKRYGGVIGIIGGLIGKDINTGNYLTNFEGTPVYLGTSDPDAHVPAERVQQTADILRNKNAQVELQIFPDAGHVILPEELGRANNFIFGYSGMKNEKP